MTTKDKSNQDLYIFLSYASEDSNSAAEVMNQLSRKPNFHVFTSDKISAGENWRTKIKKALSKSDLFLVLLSPASVKSKWVQFELGAAWGLNKAIIPVVTSPDVISQIPLELGDLWVIELESLKKPEGIELIMKAYDKTTADLNLTAA